MTARRTIIVLAGVFAVVGFLAGLVLLVIGLAHGPELCHDDPNACGITNGVMNCQVCHGVAATDQGIGIAMSVIFGMLTFVFAGFLVYLVGDLRPVNGDAAKPTMTWLSVWATVLRVRTRPSESGFGYVQASVKLRVARSEETTPFVKWVRQNVEPGEVPARHAQIPVVFDRYDHSSLALNLPSLERRVRQP